MSPLRNGKWQKKERNGRKFTSDLGMILHYISLLCGVPELAILLWLITVQMLGGWGRNP